MYCPKCSQQQSSEEMRFCSRCGFPLAGVELLLESGGIIPRVETSDHRPAPRGKMMRESAYLTLGSWAVAFASTLAWDSGVPIETVAKAGSLIFFLLGMIGLLRFLYAFLFVRDPTLPAPERAIFETSRRAALPPQQSMPASDYPRRSSTKEMAPRPSVTENTTRLLENQPPDSGE
jgi:hypothetical protein